MAAIASLALSVGKAVAGEKLVRAVSRAARAQPPTDSKGLVQSKTVQGIGAMGLSGQLAPAIAWVAPPVFAWFGYELGPEAALAIGEKLVLAAGALYAVYGRITAAKPISK